MLNGLSENVGLDWAEFIHTRVDESQITNFKQGLW
jgi:hypothetical protein